MADDDFDFASGVDDYLGAPDPAPDVRLKASMAQATDTKPDYEAELRRASERTGVPLSTARALPKVVIPQAKALDYDLDGLASRSPVTADFLSDPQNAKIAHDDTPILERVERSLSTIKDLAGASWWGMVSGSAGYLQATAPFMRALGVDSDLGVGAADDPNSAMGAYLTALRKGAKAESDRLTPKTDNALESGVNSGIVSLFQNAPMIAAAVATKNPELGLSGMAGLTGGQAFGDAQDAGKDKATSYRYAATQGAVEYLTEKLPMHQLLGDVAAKSGFVKTLFKNLALEVPGEQIATLTQDFDEWLTLHPEKSLGDFLKERPDAALATLVATGVGVTGNVTVSKVAGAVIGDRQQESRAEQAQAVGLTITQLDEAAKASKLRTRDPKTFEAFIAQATQDTPVENVYVDPRIITEVLAQGDPEKLTGDAALLQAVPGLLPKIEEALQTGGDVEIPTSQLAAYLSGSDLAQQLIPHLKTDPAGMSMTEAETFMQDHADELKSTVQRIVAQAEASDEFAQSGQRVREAVLGQLTTANRFTPDVNEAYADLTAAFYASMAQRAGMTPEAMYETHQMQIAAAGVTEGALAQFTQMSKADFNKLLADTREATAKRKTTAAELSANDAPVRFGQENGRRALVSPDLEQPGRWRLTRIDDAGPSGHTEYATKAEAVEDALREKYEPLMERARGVQQPNVDRTQELGLNQEGLFPVLPFQLPVEADGSQRIENVFGGYDPGALNYGKLDRQGVRTLNRLMGEKDFTEQEVPLADLVVTQRTVNPDFREAAQRPKGDGYDLPAVYKIDGRYVLADGHHRATAALADGDDVVMARVYDVDGARDEPLAQSDGAPRGSFNPNSNLITLLKGADLSTFLHESGHFYLETLARVVAGTPDNPDLSGDMDTALAFMGHKGLTAAEWLALPLDERREGHELFARGFEAYLMEGKAPSQELRGLFHRFRTWLSMIYQSVAGLKVSLSDDVRGVFDRMLASQQQIERMAQERGFAPLFANAEAAGMTRAEWEAYQRLAVDATEDAADQLQTRSIRDMKWLSGAKDRLVRKLQAEAKAKRKALKAEVTAEVMAEPVNRARTFLKHGTVDGQEIEGPHKLSLPELRDMYPGKLQYPGGSVALSDLPTGRYGYVAEDGVHPEQVAELFGFSSGDELVRALVSAEDPQAKIDGITDQRMLERYGDLTDPEAIENAADEALHTEARLRFVATEANALARATGGVRVLAEAARNFAADMIGRSRVRDLKPSRYNAAESRAAKAAAKLAAAGDLKGAATEKRNQVINGYAAKAVYDAKEEIEKALRYFARLDTPAARKATDPDYRDQIDALLERFDLRKSVSLRALHKRKSLADWVERQRAQGLDPIIPDELLNEANRKHFKDMTVDEVRGLVDSVRNIAHLGRLKNRLLTAKKDRDFQAVVASAEQTIRDNATRTARKAIESNRWIDRAEGGVREFFAIHRKFASLLRQMGGFNDNSVLWETLVRPMNAAGDAEAVMREQSTVALHGIFSPIIKENLRQKVFIPEIGASLSLEGRLMVALNWGNELNRARVMDGFQWNDAQVQAILKTLTPEHLAVVQGVWDHINSYWPQIAAKERRVSGVAPEKVEAAPFTVTASDGSQVEMDGGYFPIKYDPAKSTRAESDNVAELVKQSLQGAYTRATTRRGHTKARVDKVERPVRLDFGVIFQHVGEVAHDLAWHEYLIDANRLLGSAGIDGAIRDHYGREVLNTMRKALEDMALGDVPAQNVFERGVNHLRTGATVAGLGWNLVTSALQPLGLTQSMVRIGPKWVGKGMSRWLRDATSMQDGVAWVAEKSAFMRLRAKTMQREINEVRNKVSSSLKPELMTNVEASFFYFIAKAQLVADLPTWLGQYEKSMADHGDEDTAIAQADQAVRDSQGAGQIGDLSQIQRGGPLMKLFTNFYSFFNTTYNLLAESAAETRLAGPSRLPLLAADVALLIFIPSVLGTILKGALRGDDWDELPAQLAKDLLGYMFGMMVGLRDLGGIITSDGRSQAPAGLRFMQESAKLYAQVGQGDVDEAFLKAANNTAGILFHYPAGQVQRTALGIEAWAKGETHNPLALLTGPPHKK